MYNWYRYFMHQIPRCEYPEDKVEAIRQCYRRRRGLVFAEVTWTSIITQLDGSS